MPAIDPDAIAAAKRNEESTKLNLITPVLTARWGGTDRIIMEFPISDED